MKPAEDTFCQCNCSFIHFDFPKRQKKRRRDLAIDRHGFKERYAFFAWVILLAVSILTGLLIVEWAEFPMIS